jgi:MFS superfamily sulfate permease-like transporter
MTTSERRSRWIFLFPPATWLAHYRGAWLRLDAIAGITLAAYAIPVSLAYAALAGLQPQIGVYGYMLGGIGYALLGASRQLAIGPTSAISLMIAATVGTLAGGDAVKYAQIASLAAFGVAVLCLIAWLFKLSVLVRLVSDSILVGFKAGAGLTIIMSQLPSLFGVAGSGHNFFDRAFKLVGQLGHLDPLVLAIGAVALLLLLLGERFLPGKPVGITIVALAIMVATVFGFPGLGVPVTGKIPEGLPALGMPTFGLLEFDDLFPLAAGCVLLASIASIFLLLARASRPNVAFLGRLPGSGRYSDSARHADVEPLVGIIAFRPEASLLYINAETILDTVLTTLRRSPGIHLVACDLSASPYIDLAGARMLHDLHDELASRGVTLCIVGAHAQLRDLLRAEGLEEKTDSGQWLRSLDSVLGDAKGDPAQQTT